MNTTKKSITTPELLRSQADARVGEWRAAEAECALLIAQSQAAQAEKSRYIEKIPDALKLKCLDAEIRSLEARAAASHALARASAALDAADAAEDDEAAALCDRENLRGAFVEHVEEVERRRAAVAEAQRFLAEAQRFGMDCGATMKRAHAALSARRREAGLPPPRSLVRNFDALVERAMNGEGAALLSALATRDADPKGVAFIDAQSKKLRAEEIDLRAHLEQRRIDRAEAAARGDAAQARVRSQREQDARDQAAEHDARLAEIRAENRKVEQLAEAHRARTGRSAART